MCSCFMCITNDAVISKTCCFMEKNLSLIYSKDKPITLSISPLNKNQLKHLTLSTCYQPWANRIMGAKTYMWLLVSLKGSESAPTILMPRLSTTLSTCYHQAKRLIGSGNES